MSQQESTETKASKFRVGTYVEFMNEFGVPMISVITRIVPKGEYSADEVAFALKGSHGGSYVRTADELRVVETDGKAVTD